jgi:hypothetical protein
MKSYAPAILASCLYLMSVQGAAGGARAAPRAAKSNKLEGMDYISARKIILSHGWKPASGPCDGVPAKICASFPEIEVCSGVSPGYCSILFVRGRGCLSVITIGEYPGGGYWPSDTEIERVGFSRWGPFRCKKNPIG